jgi:hypothetical protein
MGLLRGRCGTLTHGMMRTQVAHHHRDPHDPDRWHGYGRLLVPEERRDLQVGHVPEGVGPHRHQAGAPRYLPPFLPPTSLATDGPTCKIERRRERAPMVCHCTTRHRTAAMCKLRIERFRFGTGRQKLVLERGTTPKRSRRASCTCEYELQSWRGESAA